MSRRFQVSWAGPAKLDLIEIAEFLASDDAASARRVVKQLRERVRTLCSTPRRGRVVPELAAQGILSYRELIVAPWRILYRIDEKEVLVVLVVDGRRNVEDVLFRRMLR
jgi:addiction module RelE/StbE family toxin